MDYSLMNQKQLPTVSVIIPTYNRAHLIGRSVRSVLNQTYTDFELIIVDDGSKDNTEDILKAFNDPRIMFIKHTINRGVCAARNTGIKSARGAYIAFQDSDDEWLPQKLEKQMAVFQQDKKGDIGLVVCEYIIVSKDGEKRFVPRVNELTYQKMLSHLGGYGEATQRFMLKRDLTASELYFDQRLPAWEEWDLLFRVSRHCRIDYARDVLVKYYRHGGPHVDVPTNRLRARKILLRKYAKELAANPRGLSFGHWQIALDYHKIGDMRRVRHHLKKAIAAYPWNPDNYLQYVAALFGWKAFKLAFNLRHFISVIMREPTLKITELIRSTIVHFKHKKMMA
jgi:glycosyltransferase involved in cell wall biosynthesis